MAAALAVVREQGVPAWAAAQLMAAMRRGMTEGLAAKQEEAPSDV